MIKRELLPIIKDKIQEGKVVLLYGPRRVGKTTILDMLVKRYGKEEKIKVVNGENYVIQKELSSQSIDQLRLFCGNARFLVIDEAQKIPHIGLNLKLLVDHIPGLKIIASGSASFSLAEKVGEPLTGRKKTLHLYPVSVHELITTYDMTYYKEIRDTHLIYGGYPELFSFQSYDEKKEYMHELVDSYLFRDIFEIEQIRNPKKIRDILTLLAFQIGKEVSLSELARALKIHVETVERYLDFMEKAFIIINVRGFSRNLRKEVTKTSRYYFYDNGVRNALINNFNPLSLRDDVGQLWENYIIIERLKRQSYSSLYANNYFWRTYDQKEIDWVEEREGQLYGYEIKWGEKKIKEPALWRKTYPQAKFEVITQSNHLSFITP